MKLVSLLGHIFELFDRTQHDLHPSDQVVDRFFRTRRYLGAKDRRFIAEAVFGMIRHKLLLETLFRSALHDFSGVGLPTPQGSNVGLYVTYSIVVEKKDLKWVAESLESHWRVHFPRLSLTEFVQAVSRHHDVDIAREDVVSRVSILHSFPRWIVEEWIRMFGESEAEALCAALNLSAPLTLRVNTLKATVEECQKRLKEQGVESARTTYSPFGLVLPKRVNLPSLQSFKDGWFEVQDEASQLVPLLINPQPGQTIIDACAGAGGKTLELGALMKNEGKIIAVDVDEGRLNNLKKRVQRGGVQNVEVRLVGEGYIPAEDEFIEKADAVLIDAPCSGLGTFRRNPGNKWKVTPEFVEKVSVQQYRLLERWSAAVRPGGRLVYATCTLLRKENETIVESFLSKHAEFALVPVAEVLEKWGLAQLVSNRYLHLYPHRHGTDGFFAAVMRRNAD